MTLSIDLHSLESESYKQERYTLFLFMEEGKEQKELYDDGKGNLTIGVGFNLKGAWNRWAKPILNKFGAINPNTGQVDDATVAAFKAIIDQYNGNNLSQIQTKLDEKLREVLGKPITDTSVEFKFTNDQDVQDVFNDTINLWEDDLKKVLPAGFPPSESWENIALLSLLFNNVLSTSSNKSPLLMNALDTGNRAEAWYQIRYCSNKIYQTAAENALRPGIAKRRYFESTLFGLFNDKNNIDNEEAENVLQLFIDNHEKIFSYENEFQYKVSAANGDYHLSGTGFEVQLVGKLLLPMELFLKDHYAKDELAEAGITIETTIDGEIRIGTVDDSTLNPGYKLTEGTEKDDMLIGLDVYNNSLQGNEGDDLLVGGVKDDMLRGLDGDDVLIGKDGNDTLAGGQGRDYFFGGDGDDTFYLQGEDNDYDVFNGGDGNDKLLGNVGNDTFRVDKFEGDNTVEEIDGGEGTDNIIAAGDDGHTIDLSGTTLSNIQRIKTGSGGDKIIFTNTDGSNSIGVEANNLSTLRKIETSSGSDIIQVHELDGSFSNLVIDGGLADDKIIGTDLDDVIDVSEAKVYSIERLEGGKGNDSITGTSNNDIIDGGDNDDVLRGGDGDNRIFGGSGADVIYGGKDIDILDGGAENDLISGGAGYNVMTGGSGADIINGGVDLDVLRGGNDNDVDHLYGGDGWDRYHARNGDVISDSDGQGRVFLDSDLWASVLSGGKLSDGSDNQWDGFGGGTYSLSGTLKAGTLTYTNDNQTITIKNFSNHNLGIDLEEKEDDDDEDFSSPLVMDLNNNGATSVSIFDSPAYFDVNGDGMAEHSGWIEGGDGLLALDKDQNGRIDNGNELFGSYTRKDDGSYHENGFAALSAYDDNKDGKIDQKDDVYQSVRVWMDGDQNGVSTEAELKSLTDLHIDSINLNASAVSYEEERNKVSHEAVFVQQQTDAEGNVLLDDQGQALTQEKAVRDVWFYADKEDTTYTFNEEVPYDVLALPEMKGRGQVMNLSHAMTLDGELKQKVAALLSASGGSLSDLNQKANALLARWTHTEDIDPNQSRGTQYILNHNYTNPGRVRAFREYAKARNVAVLEAFDGETFSMTVNGVETTDVIGTRLAEEMREKYATLRDTVVITLLGQSLFGKDIYETATGQFNEEALYARLQNELIAGTDAQRLKPASNLLSALLNRDGLTVFEHLSAAVLSRPNVNAILSQNGIQLNVDAFGNVFGSIQNNIYRGDGDDQISGAGGSTYSGGGNDTINGGGSDDVIFGDDGNDRIDGNAGNDILYGGGGDDYLGTGDGYGYDYLDGGPGNDVLTGSGRSSTFIYRYGEGHDVIENKGHVGSTPDVLELDGIVVADIRLEKHDNDMLLLIRDLNSDDPDAVSGSVLIKNGFEGGRIDRYEFEDQTLDFNQFLEKAGYKSSEYFYALSDGIQNIYDDFGADSLTFGEGITPGQLIVRADENNLNLVLAVKEDGKSFGELANKIVIWNGFSANNKIESFIFADGTNLSLSELLQLQVTDQDDCIRFSNEDDLINAGPGNDRVFAGAGNDVIIGGSGNDRLEGDAGDDVYIFNRGDGRDEISDLVPYGGNEGRDTLRLGPGISSDDLIFQREGDDVRIGLKEDGKLFEELTDIITIRGYYSTSSSIETIEFADGSVHGAVYGQETDDLLTGDDQICFSAGAGMTPWKAGKAWTCFSAKTATTPWWATPGRIF